MSSIERIIHNSKIKQEGGAKKGRKKVTTSTKKMETRRKRTKTPEKTRRKRTKTPEPKKGRKRTKTPEKRRKKKTIRDTVGGKKKKGEIKKKREPSAWNILTKFIYTLLQKIDKNIKFKKALQVASALMKKYGKKNATPEEKKKIYEKIKTDLKNDKKLIEKFM